MHCEQLPLFGTRPTSARDRLPRRWRRSGTTMIELLVAFTLLTTVISAALPLVVQHGRLLMSARHYRLALDEVSTQLDRLTALPLDAIPDELAALEVSEFTSERLPDAQLTGVLEATDAGTRLTLSLTWHDMQRATAPVQLAGWMIDAEAPSNSSDDDADDGAEPASTDAEGPSS